MSVLRSVFREGYIDILFEIETISSNTTTKVPSQHKIYYSSVQSNNYFYQLRKGARCIIIHLLLLLSTKILTISNIVATEIDCFKYTGYL